jgi:crotonobetainyl-CoA:carnitine CoA-transferase CaiB-like acyl-CoA transferase
MLGVIAALAAIEQRHPMGKGQLVASSLFETTALHLPDMTPARNNQPAVLQAR